MRGHGAQAVVAADDGDCRRDESGLGEGDVEVDTPGMHGDVLSEQAGAVLDAEEAEEGEESRTPVSGVSEDADVEVRADGVQILGGESASGSSDVVVAVPVEDAGSDSITCAAGGKIG